MTVNFPRAHLGARSLGHHRSRRARFVRDLLPAGGLAVLALRGFDWQVRASTACRPGIW